MEEVETGIYVRTLNLDSQRAKQLGKLSSGLPEKYKIQITSSQNV